MSKYAVLFYFRFMFYSHFMLIMLTWILWQYYYVFVLFSHTINFVNLNFICNNKWGNCPRVSSFNVKETTALVRVYVSQIRKWNSKLAEKCIWKRNKKSFSNETLNFFFRKFWVSYIIDVAKTVWIYRESCMSCASSPVIQFWQDHKSFKYMISHWGHGFFWRWNIKVWYKSTIIDFVHNISHCYSSI